MATSSVAKRARRRTQNPPASRDALHVMCFPTALGWMALVADKGRVVDCMFGYADPRAAVQGVDAQHLDHAPRDWPWLWVVERLRRYARGEFVTFDDVPVDLGFLTPFQRRIVKHCRSIPYGQTRSYQQIAAASGSPRAARAVGNTMASIRCAILIPCHRVTSATGGKPTSASAARRETLRRLEQKRLARSARPVRQQPRKRAASRKSGQRPSAKTPTADEP